MCKVILTSTYVSFSLANYVISELGSKSEEGGGSSKVCGFARDGGSGDLDFGGGIACFLGCAHLGLDDGNLCGLANFGEISLGGGVAVFVSSADGSNLTSGNDSSEKNN